MSESLINDSHILTTLHSSEDSQATLSQILSRSFDFTITDSITVQEMNDTINNLRSEIASTQNELDNTIIENNDLRRQITKLTQENNLLKTLCQSPIKDIQIKHQNIIKEKNIHSAHFKVLYSPNASTPSKLSERKKIEKVFDAEIAIILKQRISELENQLKSAENEIKILNEKIQMLQHKISSKM
ncbi:unnamed protein product [Parnassius apollo]|uniref:(apollo) hypothetical protein n=1 Tax=Parnassius apollo TaxID=110799 RepID=A0A8S3WLW1_PARAO|nr:unnamed protein product [Parnassius apollo]